MPNWVTNHITITGPKTTLELFVKERLSFQKFHPRPDEENENWFDWNSHHWGTKWEPDAICPLLVGERIVVSFDSAWAPPTAFLSYLTEFYEGVKIINRFQDESFCFVGHSIISLGVACTEVLDPTDFTYEALHEFSKTNTWYNYKKYEYMVHSLNECEGGGDIVCDCLSEEGRDLKSVVTTSVNTDSYLERLRKWDERLNEGNGGNGGNGDNHEQS
jgi:hypothetical protein